MNNTYYSLKHLFEIEKKISETETEIEKLKKNIEDKKHFFDVLEGNILQQKPELSKIIEKIKKHPNTARYKYDQLCSEYWDFGTKCYNFCHAFSDAMFEFPKVLKKLEEKLDSLKSEKADIESKLEKEFKLRDNLPEQFEIALEVVQGKNTS